MAKIKIKDLPKNLKIDKDQLQQVFGGATAFGNSQAGQGGTEARMLSTPSPSGPGPIPTPYPNFGKESGFEDVKNVTMESSAPISGSGVSS